MATPKLRKLCFNSLNTRVRARLPAAHRPAAGAPTLAETLAGSTCGTVSPDSRYACCQGKVEADDADSWCLDAYPELYGRQPSPVGAACTSRGPAYARACCEARARQGVDDPDCKQLYPELYDGSTPYTKNTNGARCLAPPAACSCCQRAVRRRPPLAECSGSD